MANLGALLHLEGRTIGGCRLIRRLGAGGMGEVYLAEQVRLGNRRVAVKIVRPDDDSGQDYRDAARHFLREGRMLAGFAHPHVLPVHDSGIEDGCFYLVMEYAPDGSLKDALSGRGVHPLPTPVEVSLAVEMVSQIASALQYTHDRGIVHGDVKPGNILVEMEPDGHRRMLLADYGVARDLEATAQISLVTGTVAYMAPEQFSGGFSPASDQYALAVVAYQFLAGHPPFEGGFAEQMRGHLDLLPPSLRGANPAVPRSVEAVLGRALAKEPCARYPSVLAFADALELALRHDTENTIFGVPGAWDSTISMRPALANRRQQSPRVSAPPRRPPGTLQPPIAAGHLFFANESATEQFPFAAPTTRHLNQRRLGVFAICAALLLVAMLVAIGTNAATKTHAFSPNTRDIVLGGDPKATTTATPGQTPTATPRSTPNTIENDLAGDAFAVAGISAPSSVAPGQPIIASITLINSGYNTWTSASGYRLTCDGLHPHTAQSNCPSSFSASLGGYIVAPRGSITFTFTLSAPMNSSTYNAWLSMAHGNALFSTMPALLSLAVQAPAPRPTNTPTPQPTNTPTPQPTDTPTPQPTNTPTPQPTNTPTPQPTDTPTPQPTDTPTPQPTPTSTPQPTPTDTPAPTPTTQATETSQPTSSVVQSTDPPPANTGTPIAVPTSATRPFALQFAV